MKRLLLGLAIAFVAGQIATASTTSQLRLISDGFTCTFNDQITGQTCAGTTLTADTNPTAGVLTGSGVINGWNISFATGSSNSPTTANPAFGLDLGTFVATCLVGGSCANGANLEVVFTDMNFTNPPTVGPGQFTHRIVANISGDGTVTRRAYFSNTNTNFAETTLIGALGPLSAPGGIFSMNGAAAGTANAPYSLTLHNVFTAGRLGTSISTDDSITASVPEPASVALFGTVLALCGSLLRKRKAA